MSVGLEPVIYKYIQREWMDKLICNTISITERKRKIFAHDEIICLSCYLQSRLWIRLHLIALLNQDWQTIPYSIQQTNSFPQTRA